MAILLCSILVEGPKAYQIHIYFLEHNNQFIRIKWSQCTTLFVWLNFLEGCPSCSLDYKLVYSTEWDGSHALRRSKCPGFVYTK